MSDNLTCIMLDEECFRCLVSGGVVLSGKVQIALSDIGYHNMYKAIQDSQNGRAEICPYYIKD